MKSSDEEACNLECDEDLDDVMDELALRNLTDEIRSKVDFEREERKCTFLKFQIENIQREYSNVEESNLHLRKILVENQTEIDQIRKEVVKQKETINNVCSEERQQHFSDVMKAASQVVNEYSQFQSVLHNEMQKCDLHYTEINEIKEDIKKVFDLINSSRQDQHNLLDRVESKTTKLKSCFDTISDEKIELLEKEFEKCLQIKNELLTCEVRKNELQNRRRESMENKEKVKANISDLSNRYDDWSSRYQNELANLNKNNQAVANDVKNFNSTDADKYDRIRLMLNDLKTDLNNLNEFNEKLKSQKSTLTEEVALRYHQIEIKKHEIMIAKDTIQTEGNEEETFEILQNQLNALEKNIVEMKNNFETLGEEVSPLDTEYDSYCHLIEEDDLEIQTYWDKLQDEFENFERELANFRSDENDVLQVIQKLTATEAQHELKLKTNNAFVEELEGIKSKAETNFRNQVEEVNQQINAHQEDIDAASNGIYESKLFMDALQKDFSFYKRAQSAKQLEVWTLNRENEKKTNDREELKKKITAENASFERLKNLWHDLDRNSIPKNELPNHQLFQLYKMELDAVNALKKHKVKLEREKQSLSEKVEKYDYGEYKTRQISQSFPNVHLIEKKSNQDRKKEDLNEKI